MHHSSIEPATHTAWCKCRECGQHDPIAYRRRGRVVRFQSALLIGSVSLFYALAAFNWRGIADAFGPGL